MADEGRKRADLELAALEQRISKIYDDAASDVQKKLDDYLRRFQVKDAIKRQALVAGEITQEEYTYWRTGQIMIGKRWQEMKDVLAQDLTHADQMASALVRGGLPDVYAIGHNYTAYQLENDTQVDMSFTLYDRRTVEQLLADDPDLLPAPKVDIPKDLRWNRQHIQTAVLQGILQGEDITKISKRLRSVTDMDRRAAIRNARTATTGAENAGRVESYKHAEGMGIEVEQEWLATLDGRTRDSHRHMDGERVKVGKKFSNGCRYPGDPQGPGFEVWNCRCTLVAAVKGIDQSKAPRNSKLGDMSYEEWKNEHTKKAQAQAPTLQSRISAAGTVDEINSIINSQGWWKDRQIAQVDRDLKISYIAEKQSADLTGCSLDSAKSIATSYQRIFDRYPQLKGNIGPVTARTLRDRTYAQCYIRSDGRVEVNTSWFDDWDKITQQYASDVTIGWHPLGTTADGIVVHEIGHAIDGLLARQGVLGGVNAAGEYRLASSLMRSPTMKACGMQISDTKWVLSEYGSMNPQEWFAECFAEYFTSPTPGKVATEFGRRLEELMKKVK